MQFQTRRKPLFDILRLARGVVEKKSTIEILSHILLQAKEKALTLSATDLDISLETQCDASVKKEGTLLLPQEKLYDIVSSLPDSDISFNIKKENWVEIECDRSRFRLAGVTEEKFPSFPRADFSKAIKLPREAIASMIPRVSFAITDETTRYALNGALMILNGNSIRFIATDGHRLAFIDKAADLKLKDELRAIVPRKGLRELGHILSQDGEELLCTHQDGHVFFRFGITTLAIRVIEGKFPNYEKVIPSDNNKILTLNRESFGWAVKRAAILSAAQSKTVKLSLLKGELEVAGQNPEIGEAQEKLPVDYDADPLVIGFNADYLADFLQTVSCDQITVALKEENTQGLLSPLEEESDGLDYRYVIMPMRL